MSQASCLDPVIYRVDAATRAERPGEKRVAIDINTRSAVHRDWFRFASSLKFFLVSTSGVARCQTSVIYVSDSSQERAIGLRVEFEARCAEGREERVAEALCDDPNPSAVLTGKIKEWTHEYIGQQPAAFLNEFFRTKVELASRLSARALAETGLNMNAEIFLCGEEDIVHHIQLGPVEFPVNLKDYSEPLHVRLQTELITSQENIISAIAYRADGVGIENLTQESTLQYFAENVSLHEFYDQPAAVEAGLKEYLDEALKIIGRSVQTLSIEYDRQIPSEPYEKQEEVEFRVPGHPEPIIVRNAVEIIVQDYVAYLSSNSPDLGAWLAESLNQVVQQSLFGKTYEDILLELNLATRDIKNKMSFKAAGIGCGIQQQLSITNPSVEAWLKGFSIVAADAFETALEGFSVRLRVSIAAMLNQLQDVKHYAASGLDIPELMKKRVLDEVRQTLLTVHPERLYARPVLPESAGEEPVKALLGRKIRETLVRDFKAEVISVTVEMTDTEFIKWLNDLRGETVSFEAEVSSHSPHSKGPFVFYGDCQIEDICHKGWEKVWSADFDINKIKGQLINALKSGMETRADVDLAYLHDEAAEKIRDEIARLVTDYALREFGLLVKVRNVRRKPTEVEKKVREAGLANELLRIDMLRKLEQDMIQLIANGGREEQISQVQKRIAILRAYRPSNVAPPNEPDMQARPIEPNGRAAVSTSSEDREVSGNEPRQAGNLVGN